jgi:hypothetical protein
MRKHYFFPIMVLAFLVMVNGYIFPDDEDADNDENVENVGNAKNVFPQNTITADAGLTVSTLIAWGILGETVFGANIQYERQIVSKLSVAGRFEYRGIGISSSNGNRTDLTAFSAEGHARYYPGGNTFFLDGMLGYAFFNYKDERMNSTLHYFKLGPKLGWRIDIGKPGGLVLEPSLGYYFAIGKTDMGFIEGSDGASVFLNNVLNQLWDYMIKGYFVGGAQLCFGLGYRF